MLWYSLEAPRRGASNEYHNICFRGEIRKILRGYPLLSVAMRDVSHRPISTTNFPVDFFKVIFLSVTLRLFDLFLRYSIRPNHRTVRSGFQNN